MANESYKAFKQKVTDLEAKFDERIVKVEGACQDLKDNQINLKEYSVLTNYEDGPGQIDKSLIEASSTRKSEYEINQLIEAKVKYKEDIIMENAIFNALF